MLMGSFLNRLFIKKIEEVTVVSRRTRFRKNNYVFNHEFKSSRRVLKEAKIEGEEYKQAQDNIIIYKKTLCRVSRDVT